MTEIPHSSRFRPRRLLWAIVLGLAAWGVFLAIGATGIFTDVGLLDLRRSAIVLGCSAAFLGSWLLMLFLRRHSPTEPTSAEPARNRPSLLSLLFAVAGYGSWAGAWIAWNSEYSADSTFVLGWISVALFGIAAILALVGLSDPRRERGKLWGLLTLALLLFAGVGLILQVNRYSASEPNSIQSIQQHNDHAADRNAA